MKIKTEWLDVAYHPFPANPKRYKARPSRDVEYIVVHYTGNERKDTAQSNAKYFTSEPTYTTDKNGKKKSNNASAHFFVDDKDFFQSVRMKDIAYHVGANAYYHPSCRNENSIGVEMCCTLGNYKVSDKTIERTAGLVAYLFILFGWTSDEVDTRVLRHWDVTRKMCPAQMAGTPNMAWNDFKDTVRYKIIKASQPAGPEISSLVYDTEYYAAHNPDLRKAGVMSDMDLANHFLMFGMNELRKANETFSARVYKENNEDLRKAFGDDNKQYYIHYINYGHKENRVHN